MGTNFRRQDFWNRLAGQAYLVTYDWLMVALSAIDHS